jgi:HSP20 family protein
MIVRRLWPTERNFRNAFDQLEEMRHDMRRLFGEMEGMSRDVSGVYPAMNITQDEGHFYVRAELPGLDAEEMELSAVRNRLVISGKREIAAEEGSYHRRERSGGAFSRSVTLPSEVDGTRVEAKYVDGILTVVLPKAEDAKPRQIAVKTS